MESFDNNVRACVCVSLCINTDRPATFLQGVHKEVINFEDVQQKIFQFKNYVDTTCFFFCETV